MAEFLEPAQLRWEVKSLFEEARECLLIVSPYIKLDYGLKNILETKKRESNLHIILLFGKNDDDLGKSLNSGDLRFFQQFENIEIYYHPDLHAKYYANEFKSIITSLNLHTHSIANNIEVGVMFKRRRGLLANSDNREDNKSWEYFSDLIPRTKRIFIKTTETRSSFFGLLRFKEKSKIEFDATSIIHNQPPKNNLIKQPKMGFCIRTRKPIPFDMNKPFSPQAYTSWVQYKNPHYCEKYCHFSGEPSNGETTYDKPVLRKYYAKALELKNNSKQE